MIFIKGKEIELQQGTAKALFATIANVAKEMR
jgi:hypothetical protein